MKKSEDLWMECKSVWVNYHVDICRGKWKSSEEALPDGLCKAVSNNR